MLKQKTLTLFLMRGMSLSAWEKVGTYEREIETYKMLSNHFAKINIVSYGRGGEDNFKKVLPKNITVLTNRLQLPSFIYSFLSPFIHFKYFITTDFFKTEQMDGAWSGVIAKMFFNKKLIVRTGFTWSKFHQENINKKFINNLIQRAIEIVECLGYTFCDVAIVASKDDKEYLLKKYRGIKSKINFIPNYINTEIFNNLKLLKNNDIIYVGRLSAQKNLEFLFKSLTELPYDLTIVGSGGLITDLKNIAKKLKLKINFIDRVKNYDLAKLLNHSKIFVLPSLYEGMPKALLEAMSCGLPVLASDVPGNNEVIQNNKNGVLFSLKSNKNLSELIVKLMNDEKLRIQLGANARKHILENYSLIKNINQEIKIYESLR
jgi:glycosyltransferase involved in cell wall biosynthesis